MVSVRASGPFVASPGAIAVACELYVFLTVFAHTYWRRQWHPTPVLLPGKSHGWRSLVGCSPWGREESDTTERLPFHFSLFTFLHWRRKWQPTPVFLPGESQRRGSLVAAVYGVTQSRTRQKWLSSSSSMIVLLLVGQSCLTLCNPMDCSPPGSSARGILQARTWNSPGNLEWVAMLFSRGSS